MIAGRLLAVMALAALLPGARPASAGEVDLAVGLSLAPYVFTDSWSGLEYDIVKEALALEGETVRPHLMPLARVAPELQAGRVDAAMTMRQDSGVEAYYSDVHITYRNYAITLASRHLAIASVADLAGKSVVAFQGAAKYLGPDYAAMAAHNPRYHEEAKQVVQPLLLYLGRVDVVVADRNIFGWFAGDPSVTARANTRQPLEFNPIFPPTEYRVAFADAGLRDRFDRGLARLRQSGEYRRIVARYSRFLGER